MRITPLLRGLRGLAVLATLSAGLLLGPAAGAEPQVSFVDCPADGPSPSPTPTPSPSSCTPAEGSVVRGEVPIVFDVSTEALEDLVEVTVSVVTQDPNAPSADNPVRVWRDEEGLEQERFEYSWDSATIPGYNGRYKVVVEATSEGVGGGTSSAERVDLRVDNPPQTPAAPRVTGVTDEGVRVKWSAAPEPDVLHYTLYRARTESADVAPQDSDFKAVVVTEKTALLDEVGNPGAYWYKLEVTRRSIVTDDGITSARSDRSEEPGVYVSPTPTPAPTSPPGDDDGGGGVVEPDPRPRLTPRPLPRAQRSGPPQPSDAPFSDTLPYDLPEDGSGGGGADADLAQGTEEREPGDGQQGPLPAVAIGTFLVSAALALGRLPTT